MLNIKIELPNGFLNEEVRWDYLITSKMKEVWAVELDLICEFDRVCKKHGLKYYACGGTALGVERHKGFIPWDDDVDLTMLREDYERLISLKDEFENPYFLQHYTTDKAFIFGFAKLQNLKTTALEQVNSPSCQGIFIDIFPEDNIPDDVKLLEAQKNKLLKKLRSMQIMVNSTYNYYPEAETNSKLLFKKILHALFKNLGLFKNTGYIKAKEFEKECKKYNKFKTERVSMLGFSPDNSRFQIDRNKFENIVWRDFEFIKLPCFEDNHGYLTHFFGDYMTPVKGGSYHEGIFFDANKPYTEYTSK